MAQKKIVVFLVVVFVVLAVGIGAYVWQNKSVSYEQINLLTDTEEVVDYKDLSVCGDFPVSNGDGDPGMTRYSVCRSMETGDCYYKKNYSEQVEGCDPEYSDENPYGKIDCFKRLNDIFNFNGSLIIKGEDSYRVGDICNLTDKNYFETKIK